VASRRAAAAVFIGYNVLLAVLWAALAAHERPLAHWLPLAAVFVHLGATLIPALVDATPLAELYPLLTVIGVWTEMGTILPRLHPLGVLDPAVVRLDAILFGTNWHVAWIARMPWPWLSGVMYAAYCSYYGILLVVPLLLVVTRRRAILGEYAFRLLLVYVGCALVYLIAPVVGPAAVVPAADAVRHGLFFAIAGGLQQAGDSLGTSLPSTHVAASMTIAFAAWRWFPRPLAALLTADAVVIALATVYTQNHYAIDAVAGLALAVFLHTMVAPILLGEMSFPSSLPDAASAPSSRTRPVLDGGRPD
jgi:membrane-associated phospholipid phosphatase